jgi:hypothetical protein
MSAGNGKKWAWVAGILLLILGGLYAGWHFFKKELANPQSKVVKPLLIDKLKDMIREASDSLYHVEFKKFDINIDSGKGLITGLKLIPDSAVYRRLVKAHKAPNNVLHVRIDSVILTDFGFKKTPEGRRFTIAGLTVKNPLINIINKRWAYNDMPQKRKAPLGIKLAVDLLKITSVRRMAMNNMFLTYVNQNGEKEKSTSLRHWSIAISNGRIHKIPAATGRDSSKNNQLDAMEADMVAIATPDSLYRIKMTDTKMIPQQRIMSAAQFSVVPRLSKAAFYKAAGYDKDRFYFIYRGLVMRNIDIPALLHRQQIHIGNASVASSWCEVYNDYHWPRRTPPLRPRAFPQQKLQDLAFDITIDTMKMHQGFFRYVIAARKSQENAVLFMTNMDSRIINITNNTAAKKRNAFTTGYVYNKTMGAAATNLTCKFNLISATGQFSINTRMGPMDGRALNSLAGPLALIAVKQANISKMNLFIEGNSKGATGNLNLHYTGMKLNLLKRDDDQDTLKKRGFLSFLTNMAVPNDNPGKNGKFRQGPINVTRGPRDSFFGLLWLCTLDGMSSATMGFNQKKEKPNENILIKAIKTIVKPQKSIKKKE